MLREPPPQFPPMSSSSSAPLPLEISPAEARARRKAGPMPMLHRQLLENLARARGLSRGGRRQLQVAR